MVGSIGASTLLGWYQSFFGGTGTDPNASLNASNSASSSSSSSSSSNSIVDSILAVKYAPTAPWNETSQPSQSQLVKQALGGANLFNPAAAQLDMQGASADYKNLFALYSGLNSLYAIATQASGKNVTSTQIGQLSTAFSNGMSQLSKYLAQTSFASLKLTPGVTQQSQTSTASTPQQQTSYTTAVLNSTGDSNAVVPAFQGNVSFNIGVQLGGGATLTVPIDLGAMGSTPRTMGNVVAFMNGQLKAAGALGVSFSSVPVAGAPDTIQVGGKTVTVAAAKPQWALQLHTNPAETVTLSAPSTGPAIYIGQSVGNTASSTSGSGATVAADAQNQLLKFDGSGASVVGPTPPPFAAPDQISTATLGSSVSSVQAEAVAPDGSLYVLANVTANADGSTPAGGQDVALQKYDSAGKLVFSHDLGSVSSASGLSLAVSADGTQVAVAGQVTGSLTAGNKVNDPTGANSFVAVYDSEGQQSWISQDDGVTPNQANAVAFGADGSVYVTGSAQASAGLQGSQSPSNSFLQVFSKTGAPGAVAQIATGGPNTSNSIAVDGTNVYVAGVQNGDAVVSEYDLTNPQAPTLVASRDLGSLGGGTIAGIAVQNGTVYVAGNTRNTALNAGAVTSAAPGNGLTAFAATLSTGLAPAGSDAIAYYGGASGDTKATGMTVANGDVYLTGSATGDLPGEPAIGAQDGFIAALNVGAGTVDYAQRFTGLDGKVAPTSIAVAPTGASVLDQLGLPQGVVDGPVSNLVTATTGVAAGDSFKIAVNGGAPVTITVSATDTMASLASEISKATGYIINAATSPAAGGGTALEIKAAYPGSTVTLSNGPAGKDALAALGLKPGVVADTVSQNGATVLQGSSKPIFSLGLPASLDLSSTADIKTAQVQLAGAVSVVEQAYQHLKTAATPANVVALQKAQTSGTTPKYLSDEIANYQSALTRLTASQNSSSTSSLASLI
ncbi:MAG TPA: hypothetical protein VKQ70_08805 [Caulobacteraceae bacterium]|nr:hypothetical protein [Caulobacteraceae bacterium]